MDNFLQHPDEVPELLYIVHEPSEQAHSPYEIGFRPFDILSLDAQTASNYLPEQYGTEHGFEGSLPSIYVIVTDKIDIAQNEVIESEEELVMYTLNGRCADMKKCSIFKVSPWLRALDAWNEREDESEHQKLQRQHKLRHEWLVWPGVPKEAIIGRSTRDDIMRESEPEDESPPKAHGQKQQKTSAGSSQSTKVAETAHSKEKPSSDSGRGSGFTCKDVDSDGNPQYQALLPEGKEKKKFPFSTIYTIEKRGDIPMCLVHWSPDTEPSWVEISNVDNRAVMECRQREAHARKYPKPTRKDPFEILFEEPLNETFKLDSKYLVRWTKTGRMTWEEPRKILAREEPIGNLGVTRQATDAFTKKKSTWKRYRYT